MRNRNSCLTLTMTVLALALSSQRAGAEDITWIYLWDAKTGKPIHTIAQEGTSTSVAFSPDGAVLASGSGGGGHATGILNIWDVKTGKLVRKDPSIGAVKALKFFPDGKTLAVATHNATLLVSRRAGQPIAKLGDGYATYLDVSDDGAVVVSNAGGKVAIWDVATRKAVAKIKPKDYAYGVSISPDNKTVAFGSRAGGVGIVELATGKLIHAYETPKLVQAVAFSPDGKRLAAGNVFNGEIYIWDVSTHKKVTEATPARRGIFSLAWGPREAFLVASLYHDRLVTLLDPKTGKQLLDIGMHDMLGARWVAVSPDGNLIAAACAPTVMR